MKKWYAIGLLVVALVLAASVLVACGEETTETTAAETETTVAETETTVAETDTTAATTGGVDVNTIGLYFEELGNNIVKVTDVPAPGLQFPIHTIPDDDFAVVVEVLDAGGAVLGTLDTENGEVDYSAYADTAAKIKVTTKAGDSFEYELAM
jgi:hypothetical protein